MSCKEHPWCLHHLSFISLGLSQHSWYMERQWDVVERNKVQSQRLEAKRCPGHITHCGVGVLPPPPSPYLVTHRFEAQIFCLASDTLVLISCWHHHSPADWLFLSTSAFISTLLPVHVTPAAHPGTCHIHESSYCSAAKSCPTLCDPMDCSSPGTFVLHYLPEFALTHVYWVGDASQPSHSLLSPSLLPSIFPSIRVFPNESALHIRWPKYWSFSFSISPSNVYSGLVSFRKDWFYLLAVQGMLKSFLQHHSSKASILQCSSFIVQLSHLYMTTGKKHEKKVKSVSRVQLFATHMDCTYQAPQSMEIFQTRDQTRVSCIAGRRFIVWATREAHQGKTIALIIRIFVGKVMSLLFKTLSRFVTAFLLRNNCLLTLWLQSAATVISEHKKIKSATVSTSSPSICQEVMGLNAMILVFWMLSFKPAFSLSSFILIKRLFSSSLFSAVRVLSSAYLRSLIFLPAILIPACESSPAFHMMYSACTLNEGDNIQPWHTPFPIWNQSVVPCVVLTIASWPEYKFLRRQVRWSDIPISLRIFNSLLWSTQSKGLA